MSNLELRHLLPGDWALFRQVRLQALADSPEAFSSSLERELEFDETVWRSRLQPGQGPRLIAVLDGVPVGMAAALLPEEPAGTVELVGMWVHPEARKNGVGTLLVEEIAAWSIAVRRFDLRLWVVEGNGPAEHFYRRLGFKATGATQPHPNDPGLRELRMTRDLSA